MGDLVAKTKLIQTWAGAPVDGDYGTVTADAIIAKAGLTGLPPKQIHLLSNPTAFFNAVRTFTNGLNAVQVNSINALLSGAEHWPISWIAYALATAWHESRLQPIKEIGSDKYLDKYDTGALAARLGNTPEDDDDGILYAGRGFVQLTGRRNYRNAGVFLGVDLLKEPDLALRPDYAARILIWGMEGGEFTGRDLADYLPNGKAKREQFVLARKIINGLDKADLIAGYAADHFQPALELGGW